ncbi:hypothetical protein HMI54_006710 [Coelomomyces lativittatus]|nr:hypothetical protein HMI54_006710 [Coelomomyces lativittatus]KAJ1504799.1 hypothetical protein HMI56_001453 [Coelomomyces lativittatus]
MSVVSVSRLFFASKFTHFKNCSRLIGSYPKNSVFRPNSVFRHAYSSLPPHTIVAMPALSPTMTQGNIGSWKKEIGASIAPGDVLVEIETDKALMEFECQEEGVLANILLPTGSKDVPVGEELAIICEKPEDVEAFKNFSPSKKKLESTLDLKPQSPTAPLNSKEESKNISTSPVANSSNDSHRIFASPLAKNIAQEKGVSLKEINGSGPGNRIVKSDVLQALSEGPKSMPKTPGKLVPEMSATSFIELPLTNMRKVIAQRLTASKQEIPHYYLTSHIDMGAILKLRTVLNTSQKIKLSLNDFIIKACALSLLKVPQVNSQWHDTCIRQFKHADVSVAVATPSGLITPIVSNAETLGLLDISTKMKDLIDKAKNNSLAPHEYQGGTFTISNLGMFDIKSFTAIINPPQSAILAVGGLEEHIASSSKPNEFQTVQRMNVTLSCDHRVIDGAIGAQFLKVFKNYMEAPLTMLL